MLQEFTFSCSIVSVEVIYLQKNLTMTAECIKDMVSIAETGRWPLEAQVRAYDLFDSLADGLEVSEEDKEAYLKTYEDCSERLSAIFDADALKNEAEIRMRTLEDELNESRFKAAAAASLHEFAKDTFAEWQTAGVFMRKRLLKDPRARAGFRLESHRIGNYVAKTYDLMEEARRAYQKTQQACYTNNVGYKCSSMLYGRIAEILKK